MDNNYLTLFLSVTYPGLYVKKSVNPMLPVIQLIIEDLPIGNTSCQSDKTCPNIFQKLHLCII